MSDLIAFSYWYLPTVYYYNTGSIWSQISTFCPKLVPILEPLIRRRIDSNYFNRFIRTVSRLFSRMLSRNDLRFDPQPKTTGLVPQSALTLATSKDDGLGCIILRDIPPTKLKASRGHNSGELVDSRQLHTTDLISINNPQ